MNENNQTTNSEKNVKCQQCSNPAILMYANSIPLCADCYHKVAQAIFMEQQALHNKLSWFASQLNFLEQDIYMGTGGLVPLRQAIIPQPPNAPINFNSFNQIKISDSSIGLMNTGTLFNIDTSLSIMQQRGDQDLAMAVKKLTQAVIDNNDINIDIKEKLIEQLEFILNEALKSPDNQRKSIIKTIVNNMGQSLQAVAALFTIWNAVEPLLKAFFGI